MSLQALAMNTIVPMDTIAERLRREPFQMFWNNCLRKSFKFKRDCDRIGVSARVVLALVLVPCKWGLPLPYIVWFHAWAEVNGQRIELARPLSEKNTAGTLDSDIRPVVGIWM